MGILKKNDSPQGREMDLLPEEILLDDIFPKCSAIGRLSWVCKKFNHICLDESLWRNKVKDDYPYYFDGKPWITLWIDFYKFLHSTWEIPVHHKGEVVKYTRVNRKNITYAINSIREFGENVIFITDSLYLCAYTTTGRPEGNFKNIRRAIVVSDVDHYHILNEPHATQQIFGSTHSFR